MLRIRTILLSLVVVAMSLIVPAPWDVSSAHAADFCGVPVYAGNDTIDPNNAQLQTVIGQLKTLDVEVHVIVQDSSEGLDAAGWADKEIAQCPDWKDPVSGNLKARMLVIFISTGKGDHYLFTNIGSGLVPKISDSEATSIREDIMVPDLQADGGVVTFAVVDGLNAFYDQLTKVATPSQPAPTSSSSSNKPVDVPWGTIGMVVLVLLGLALGVFLFVKLNRALTKKFEAKKRFNDLVSTVKAEQQAALSASAEFYLAVDTAVERANIVLRLAHQDEAKDLRKCVEDATRLYESLSSLLTVLNGSSEPVSEPEWKLRREQVARISSEADELRITLDQMKLMGDAYEKLALGSKDAEDRVQSQLAKLVEGASSLRQQGFKIEMIDQQISEIKAIIAGMQKLFTDSKYESGSQQADSAEHALQKAFMDAEDLPKQHDKLVAEARSQQDRLQKARGTQTATEALHAALREEYGDSNLRDVRGFGSHADELLDHAEKLLQSIDGLVAMSVQDYSGARRALEQSETLLAQAEALYQEVSDLKTSLDNAKQKATSLAASLDADLRDAVEYCRSVQDDAGTDEIKKLNDLQPLLERTQQLLNEAHPDVRDVLAQLKKLQANITQLMEHAEEEYQTAKQQRNELARKKRDAQASLDELDRYIRSHSRDISRRHEDAFSALRNRSMTGTDYATTMLILREIEREAQEVHEKCRREVSTAVASRQSSYDSGFGSGSHHSRNGGSSFDFGGGSSHSSFGGSSFGDFGGGSSDSHSGGSSW